MEQKITETTHVCFSQQVGGSTTTFFTFASRTTGHPTGNTNRFGLTTYNEMGATGFEPVTPSVSSWCSSQLS